MREISIFIDESGDFGEYDYHSPYYIISMVIHNQSIDINENLNKLEYDMSCLGMPNHCIHAGPIIRGEDEYRYISLDKRKKIIKNLMSFARKTELDIQCIYIEKKHLNDSVDIAFKLTKELSAFVKNNVEYFNTADVVKIYYDNGQVEITKILLSVFSVLLDNVEYKKVIPSNYRLFQVADLACTIKLTELKYKDKTVSRSEQYFFENKKTFNKNYLKTFKTKNLHVK